MSCFVCKQKKAYEMRISEWSSDVCSSDLSRVDTALQVHGVDAGGNVFQAFFNDGLSQNGSGGGTVASVVGGLGSEFLDQLGAAVFEFVFPFDFFSNRHAVFSNGGGAARAIQTDVAALGKIGRASCRERVCKSV